MTATASTFSGTPAEQAKAALLDTAADFAEDRRHQGHSSVNSPINKEILRHYFDRSAPQDLAPMDPIDLYGAATQHLQLAQGRKPGEAQVRLYNPRIDDHGWTSDHTVIDIVTDDMPFLVNSVLALLEQRGHQVHVLAHPIFEVERSPDGSIEQISVAEPDRDNHQDSDPNAPADDALDRHPLESLIHLEVDRIGSLAQLTEVHRSLEAVLDDIRKAVSDWDAMTQQALAIADELDSWVSEAEHGTPRFESEPGTDPAEVAQLLRWMAAGWFTFMGYREYDLDDPMVISRPQTGLGTLRQSEPTTRDLGELPEQIAAVARRPTVVNLTKANSISSILRSVPLDYIGIKEIDGSGHVTGERRFIGLFTSDVYADRVEDIPVVRAKVAAVMDRADFHRTSHDHSRLRNVLQLYPRDELFQMRADELERMAHQILDLRDRRQVSLLVRQDTFGRFLSCLVYVPRDRYNTSVRLKIQDALMEAYGGVSCRYSTEISAAPMARVGFVIRTNPAALRQLPARGAVEARLAQITRTWDDYLRDSLLAANGEEKGLQLLELYANAFDASYRSNVLAESAVQDIERLESLGQIDLDVALQRPLEAGQGELRCKLYRTGDPITLTQFISIFHDLGATVTDERPYEIYLNNGYRRFIYDIGLTLPEDLHPGGRALFREAVLAVWSGACESDRLARLVVTADLGWRDISVLRAYARYLIQLGIRFSPRYVIQTLSDNPAVARLLVQLFRDRLDQARPEFGSDVLTRAQLLETIDAVSSLDADQIFRSFMSVIDATVRTNYWQTDETGLPRPTLTFKLEPTAIPDAPKPVPLAEVFVYSPRTEGVHLRSGRIARGGLRWSDRMEDYRTEVLGLLKAQAVKNSVIVPDGAKGGFVARNLPPSSSPKERAEEVVACYKLFVAALLDITDNVVDGIVTPPARTTRCDGDDPYLVVAADKGTATFSDVANGLAVDRGFWLADAFASGGSAGFDHKELGITARGAWVSVLHHFRALGIDPESSSFDVVGIGDMSGDVFGNGLLTSPNTRLLAAFDHRHIFVDPTPDPATSLTERARLFAMPRSSWADYDPALISHGGGVFARSAKSIPITTQMKEVLGLEAELTEMTPTELIQTILLAPVDLLWNGGIGTYVKSTSESHGDVDDHGNDRVRVDAEKLRCKVIGEGGNLGLTQAARIEFAALGGRINTDAIDNSAGVDCSDHEVNLKILLAAAEASGDLTRKQRNQLLDECADTVSLQVLEDNWSQNEALSAAETQTLSLTDAYVRLMQCLERDSGLDRAVETLPSDNELAERSSHRRGLTRPELAVLLAYSKNHLASQLVRADLDTDSLSDLLLSYFPQNVQDFDSNLIQEHALRSEILSTMVANQVVNRGGISMVHRLMEETSTSAADVAMAHLAAWRIFGLENVWLEIRDLGFEVSASTQTSLHLAARRLGERATRWLLRNATHPIDVRGVVERIGPSVEHLLQFNLTDDTPLDVAKFRDQLCGAAVPRDLAEKVAKLGPAYGLLDVARCSEQRGLEASLVAAVHTEMGNELDLHFIRELILGLPRSNRWAATARSALRDQYFGDHARLAASVASQAADGSVRERADTWLKANRPAVDRFRRTTGAIQAADCQDLATASVAIGALSQLSQTG